MHAGHTQRHNSNTTDSEPGVAGGGWVADITLVAHVGDATGELIAELSDGSRLPAAVLEELSCNARWTGLVYDRCGDAIRRSRSRRTVTNSQWQTLLTDYGGCFHCGAPPAICQAHHIIPYSQGGETSVNNNPHQNQNRHPTASDHRPEPRRAEQNGPEPKPETQPGHTVVKTALKPECQSGHFCYQR